VFSLEGCSEGCRIGEAGPQRNDAGHVLAVEPYVAVGAVEQVAFGLVRCAQGAVGGEVAGQVIHLSVEAHGVIATFAQVVVEVLRGIAQAQGAAQHHLVPAGNHGGHLRPAGGELGEHQEGHQHDPQHRHQRAPETADQGVPDFHSPAASTTCRI
jgi:hypothetical protein